MPFDTHAFMKLVEGDKDLAGTLLQLYKNDWPNIFKELEKAIKENRFNEVEKLAHRLKGTVRNFFADEPSQIAETIETAGRYQLLEGVGEQLARLKKSLQGLQVELEEFQRTL